MNRRGNLTNVLTHLQEHNSYKLLTHNTNNATAHDARTQQTLYAFPTHNRYGHHGNSAASLEYTHTSLLWVIKKIHKFSLHPIVSGYDGPTDPPSSYITHFIHPLANNLQSHLKNTKHFLNLI